MTAGTTLVVGGGGFLGRALVRELGRDGQRVVVPSVPWDRPEAAASVLHQAVTSLQSAGVPWRLVWAAGTGIVASDETAFAAESALIDQVLDARAGGADGAVFFASSAGAVYAGATGVPFDESTTPVPLAPYGHSRLRAEERFRAFAEATGARLLVGRIANLFGPGANLRKPQGLVSQLALAHVEGRASSIYVPMETTRDYLYIDDAAAMIASALAITGRAPAGSSTTKIFASQHGHTITEVVEAVERAFGEPLVVHRRHDPSATSHGVDLRFRSGVLPEVDERTLVPFDDGVGRTVAAIRALR